MGRKGEVLARTAHTPVRRSTNQEIQKWIMRRFGFVVETAWIEQARGGQDMSQERGKPDTCPAAKWTAVEAAFHHFGINQPRNALCDRAEQRESR
ncbi:MAG: hypothetical protein ACRD22_01955 [Terriglobia bacterium]